MLVGRKKNTNAHARAQYIYLFIYLFIYLCCSDVCHQTLLQHPVYYSYFQRVYVVINRKHYFDNVISQIQTECMQCAPLEGNQHSPGGVEIQESRLTYLDF